MRRTTATELSLMGKARRMDVRRLLLWILMALVLLAPIHGFSESSVPNHSAIGPLIEIDVYVNDIKVNTPVYKNNTTPPVAGPHNLGDFVLLEPVCEALGATFECGGGQITLLYKETKYVIEETIFGRVHFVVEEDAIYVSFGSLRFAMDGGLKQDDYDSMYLYTPDFERLDIPATLEECYAALDDLLNDEVKEDIKTSDESELVKYHFGLGMWIRNNWIYPTDDRITKVLHDAGVEEADGMSSIIIHGYHNYLNGIDYEIK